MIFILIFIYFLNDEGILLMRMFNLSITEVIALPYGELNNN